MCVRERTLSITAIVITYSNQLLDVYLPNLNRAFITQFSRSMHAENLHSGLDFLVVMPLYVVSNLFKKDSGSFFWPMPIKLVEGTFAQLGKKMVYQGHGYWVHGGLSLMAQYNPFALVNNLGRMNVSCCCSLYVCLLLLHTAY